MDFNFTKEVIDNAEFSCKNRKYYDVTEVDEFLNKLSYAAEQQEAELARLRAVEEEYIKRKDEIADVLLSARKMALAQAEQEKAKYTSEMQNLELQRRALTGEVAELQQKRTAVLEQCRQTMGTLLKEIERNR